MRILVDIPQTELTKLTQISASTRRPRASIIREAITNYLAARTASETDDAFGLWGDHEVDGLEYQRKLRAEW